MFWNHKLSKSKFFVRYVSSLRLFWPGISSISQGARNFKEPRFQSLSQHEVANASKLYRSSADEAKECLSPRRHHFSQKVPAINMQSCIGICSCASYSQLLNQIASWAVIRASYLVQECREQMGSLTSLKFRLGADIGIAFPRSYRFWRNTAP